LHDRIRQFLEYAAELVENAQVISPVSEEGGIADPLGDCLDAVATYVHERSFEEDVPDDQMDTIHASEDGSYRIVSQVRKVDGRTAVPTRERLALAFNSPLFPEILVSSVVMGEGIDLHRFCRHVIHHDGYWNPSVMEQQTGRLDRIQCKAEMCGQPIHVYQPFIAGGADERMCRVLRDRERWFQIVMGQKFEFDEAASETIAERLPMPEELARPLMFNLSRWKPEP
jgi:hypothetical protein